MNRLVPILMIALAPAALGAQQDPVELLPEVLPAELAAQVAERIEAARARALPAQSLANLALEGVAKGRTSTEVLAAVDLLLADLGRADAAFRAAGRAPAPGEVEAATTALRMGVDAETVSALARSAPSGRALAVPLVVLGGLTQRGLASDAALTAVSQRLAARVGDAQLLQDFPGLGVGPGGPGGPPAGVAPNGRGAGAGGTSVPSGPPDANPGRPGGAGGPGNGRGGGPPNQ